MLPGLEFAPSTLSVSYRASHEPQTLSIALSLRQQPVVPWGPAAMPLLCEVASSGGAGGGVFAPSAGRATIRQGPNAMGPDALDTEYRWDLEVASVDPLFMRTIVERLSLPDDFWLVTKMSLFGSLALDDTDMSVSEGRVVRWLDDPTAYPKQWPELPFKLVEREVHRGAGVRLVLGQPTDHDTMLAFTRTIELFNQAIIKFVNTSLDAVGLTDATPRISRSANELTAGYDAFDFVHGPARATLLNMLVRFHEQVAPVREAHIALANV